MRLLVTGAAGFIGSHYVRTLLSSGFDGVEVSALTVLDKLTYAGVRENLAAVEDDPRFRFVLGDILRPEVGMFRDVLALLQFAWTNGFLKDALVGLISWRAIFWVNIPLIAATVTLALDRKSVV